MLQNNYTLPDLIDLALVIPEVGAVNFNILHTVLHTIVKELNITDVRPYCHIENPLLAKSELMRVKLKEVAHKRSVSLSENVGVVFPGTSVSASSSDKEQRISKSKEETPFVSPEKPTSVEQKQPPPPAVTKTAIQTEDVESVDTELSPTRPISDESKLEDKTVSGTTKHEAAKKEQQLEKVAKKETTQKPEKGHHAAEDFWKYKNLESRVEAAEETLQSVSGILDTLVNKIMKSEKRKKEGGPSSEELEVMDERLLELEESMTRAEADHDLLLDIDASLNKMLKEFEAIKTLASLLEQMQLDISKKADKEETWAALALKGDLELVNTKVDQLEFETAIEELGEAIGLLGLKFTRKNDEWEERVAEIWRAIDGKMTRDIFEVAKEKTELRLKALLYGLRKLKKVVEDLLYPESSGVTRCILCRRAACISGLECLGISDSPKRRLSDKSSEDEGPQKLKEIINDVIAKKQKLDGPPYSKMHDTILTLPYSSSSYQTSIDKKQEKEMPKMKLMPIAPGKDSTNLKKISQIPKLPEINNDTSSSRSDVQKSSTINRRTRAKSRVQKTEPFFIKKMRERLERSPPEKDRATVVLETEPPKRVSSRQSSAKSSEIIDLTPDPDKTLEEFTPSRRNILVSPTSPNGHEVDMILSPLQFDTKSNENLSTRISEKEETETSESSSTSSIGSAVSRDT